MSAEELNLDEEVTSVSLTLVSKDNQSFTVESKNAIIAKLIKSGLELDSSSSSFDLQVNGSVLSKIVEYMNHHQGTEADIVEKPLRHKDMEKVCKDPFDAKFIDQVDQGSRQDLYDIILAANYMDIPALLHLGCAKVASLIKGQPLEKIKDILAQGTTTTSEKQPE